MDTGARELLERLAEGPIIQILIYGFASLDAKLAAFRSPYQVDQVLFDVRVNTVTKEQRTLDCRFLIERLVGICYLLEYEVRRGH